MLVVVVVVALLGGGAVALRLSCDPTTAATDLDVLTEVPATTTLPGALSDGIVVDDVTAGTVCDAAPTAFRASAVDADDTTLTLVRLGSDCERVASVEVAMAPDAVRVRLTTGEPSDLVLGVLPRARCDDAGGDRLVATVVSLPEPVAGRPVLDATRS